MTLVARLFDNSLAALHNKTIPAGIYGRELVIWIILIWLTAVPAVVKTVGFIPVSPCPVLG
jgi:hypothetical protein